MEQNPELLGMLAIMIVFLVALTVGGILADWLEAREEKKKRNPVSWGRFLP